MGEIIKTFIVDDEAKSLSALRRLFEKYCPEVKVVGEAGSVADAVKGIDAQKPELVFLDIVMVDGQGFDVLEKTTFNDFEVIFITAHDEFATKAFEFAALHYLLKPVSPAALAEAVKRAKKRKAQVLFEEKIEVFKQSIHQKPERIILPTGKDLEMISIDHIIRCEADGNYTTLFMKDGIRKIISKPISYFEKLLSGLSFCRLHNSHLINMKYMVRYVKGKAGYVVMTDNKNIYISSGRKNHFLECLGNYARSL